MHGIVLTTSAPKDGFPIQVVFPKDNVVLGFREDGYFFEWKSSPKLELIKPNFIKKGLNYVANMLRPKSKMDSDKPQS